jgi:hypothetical protein
MILVTYLFADRVLADRVMRLPASAGLKAWLERADAPSW